MAKMSIIIPVYFGENLLYGFYNELREKVLLKLVDYEVVMIDDGSKDNSWSVMQSIAACDGAVKLVKLSRNFGANKAMYVGFCEATGDCVAMLPQDLQTPVELVLEMFESWNRGNKVVLITRFARKDPKWTSSLFYWFTGRYVNNSMPKTGLEIGLLDRRTIEIMRLMNENDSSILLQVLWMGFKSEILPYVRENRIAGKSGYDFSKRLKLAIDSIVGFSCFPIRFISIAGMIFFVSGVLWAIWIAVQRLFVGIAVQGWTTIMIVLLVSFGLIMVSLAILGEYIWRILDASRHRPVYIIEEVIEAKNVSGRDETGNLN